MTPQEFYEEQRKRGLTDDITCNPEPDYSLPFYQQIFSLMEEYAKQKTLINHDDYIFNHTFNPIFNNIRRQSIDEINSGIHKYIDEIIKPKEENK